MAGASPEPTSIPLRSQTFPPGRSFRLEDMTATIPTDLVTPLGAYLRLRRLGAASFLLESVEQGRLGRYSFVGCGSRLVSFEEAESEAAPVVGYLGYDYVARIEPTVPLPAERPDLPESRFVVADVLVRIDHVSSVAEVLAGDPAEIAVALADHVDEPAGTPLESQPDRAHAGSTGARAPSAPREGAHRRGRRVPDRPLAAGRTPDGRVGRRALPGACAVSTRRPTSSCSSSAT